RHRACEARIEDSVFQRKATSSGDAEGSYTQSTKKQPAIHHLDFRRRAPHRSSGFPRYDFTEVKGSIKRTHRLSRGLFSLPQPRRTTAGKYIQRWTYFCS